MHSLPELISRVTRLRVEEGREGEREREREREVGVHNRPRPT